jgi:hypothetical protein
MRNGFAISCSVIVAASVLAACGGSGSTAKGPATNSNNSGTASAGQLSSAELSTLVAAAAKQKFKVTYTDGSGDTLLYAQDGNGNVMQGNSDSESFSTSTATISCDKSSGTFQCTSTPGASSASDSPFTSVVTLLQSYLSARDDNVGSQSTKTIAGRAAQCVTFSAKDLTGNVSGATAEIAEPKVSATFCIDADTGATLEVSATDATGKPSTSLKVTDFGTPSPSDFVPPVPPG